ncbi:MAG: chromate efflux transporter [Tepidisphaeraceae bacterium]
MDENDAERPAAHPLAEVIVTFTRLGLLSFGGPVAHLGYFHNEVVKRRQWVTEETFTDLVALCQFLPGPGSSQLVFVLGRLRAGWLGAVAASVCFTLPSMLLMIGCAYGLTGGVAKALAPWLHGLMLAAVAVVAHAVWSMGRSLCPDRLRVTFCFAAAAVLLLVPGVYTQLAVLAGGAAFGLLCYRSMPVTEMTADATPRVRRRTGIVLLAAFGVLLFTLPPLAKSIGDPRLAAFAALYRVGALVFGGGHVVLPLLNAEMVRHGWVSGDAFLAGYGLAQVLPGPLFTFAGYLGATMPIWPRPWVGGLVCTIAIFLPGWLLVAAALPHWQRLRAVPAIRSALAGTNAAVVGVLLAALYDPVSAHALRDRTDAVVAAAGFVLLVAWKWPAVAVVVLWRTRGRRDRLTRECRRCIATVVKVIGRIATRRIG